MIVAQAFCIGGVFPKYFEGISIEPVQPIAGAKPHESFIVL
jgi:hypothetical protein